MTAAARCVLAVLSALALCSSTAACGSRLAQQTLGTAPGASSPAANCAGFHGGPGVDEREITIGNASDIGGLTPGLFHATQQAVAAFVAFFNSTSDICGRKLKLLALDSRGDTGGDQAAAAEGCRRAFALVGSMSSADLGGARTVSDCGIPDLRATVVHPERAGSPVVYAARPARLGQLAAAVPDHFVTHYPDAVRSAAFIYVGTAAAEAQSRITGYASRGFNWVYQQAVDDAEFNYAPYAMQLKQRGVHYVQFLGPYRHAVRLAQAMQQQGVQPAAFLLDPAVYSADFARSAVPAVPGTKVFTDVAPLDDGGENPELQLYAKWLAETSPGAMPSYFGVFAWSAARLFTELASGLGGNLSRPNLLAALAAVTGWDGHGLSVPQDVGGRNAAPCVAIMKLEGGRWVRETEDKFVCGELVGSGIGG